MIHLTPAYLFMFLGALVSLEAQADITLGARQAAIAQQIQNIVKALNSLQANGQSCSDNFITNVTCPSVMPKGARDEFINPSIRDFQGYLKQIQDPELVAAVAFLDRPDTNVQGVNAGTGANAAVSGLCAQRTANLNKVQTAVSSISKNVSSKISVLTTSTAQFTQRAQACASAAAGMFAVFAGASLPRTPDQALVKIFEPDSKHPRCSPQVLNTYVSYAQKGNDSLPALSMNLTTMLANLAADSKSLASFCANNNKQEQLLGKVPK